jgi:predicted  nucleic acid-binding Zn-ribbon protein
MMDEKQALSEALKTHANIIEKLQHDIRNLRGLRNEQAQHISFLEERLKMRSVVESRMYQAEQRVRELESMVKRLRSEKEKLAQLWPQHPQYFFSRIDAPILYAVGKKRRRRAKKDAAK